MRHIHLSDNMGMTLALTKGRGRSFKSLLISRRVCALSVACDASFRYRWVPSESNVVDKESRLWESVRRWLARYYTHEGRPPEPGSLVVHAELCHWRQRPKEEDFLPQPPDDVAFDGDRDVRPLKRRVTRRGHHLRRED